MKFSAIKFFICALALSAAHGTSAEISLDLAETLLKKSGTWKQLENLPKQIAQAREQRIKANPASNVGNRKDVAEAEELAFNSTALQGRILQSLAKQMTVQTAESVVQWYNSDLGIKITRAEESATAGDSMLNLEKGKTILLGSKPKRTALLEKMVVTTNVADFMYSTLVNITASAIQGASSVTVQKEGIPSASAIKQMFSPNEIQMKKAFSEMYLGYFAFTYDAFTDEQLASYIDFLSSPAGKAFGDQLILAFDSALTKAGEQFGILVTGFASYK